MISQFYENAEVYFQVIGRSLYIVNESTKVINETFFKGEEGVQRQNQFSIFIQSTEEHFWLQFGC